MVRLVGVMVGFEDCCVVGFVVGLRLVGLDV